MSDPLDIDARLYGLLGGALDANRRGRLSHFVEDERSPAIALFGRAVAQHNVEGDWYGEHAGKWLVAAAKAAARSGDATLAARVERVADFLVAQQEPDGYLGTYAPSRRFMVPQPPPPPSWNGEPSVRTWDVWVHSYLILGLLEVHRHFPDARRLAAACRIGDLCIATLASGAIPITSLGNHFGLSATVLIDPAMALFDATGQRRYLDLAQHVLDAADRAPMVGLVTRGLAGADAAEIATGKAYQLAWNLVGLAKLHRATGEPRHRAALERLWASIRDQHLTLGGGPWGGVAHRSREVFNAPGSFDPGAYVETCSTLAWIQLNRELLAITDDPRHADEIEKSAYNDLLGAMAPNGEDWCYYSFANGRRVHTTYWRCCKSSGAMAVEELPALAARADAEGTLTLDLYGPATFALAHPSAGKLRLEQRTSYPADGAIELVLHAERAARWTLRLRIPAWADAATVQVGDASPCACAPGRYYAIGREWRDGDRLVLRLPMRARTRTQHLTNVQVSRAPDGSKVRQGVLDRSYVAVTRGPLVYATGLVDGFKTEETLRLPAEPDAALAERADPLAPDSAPIVELRAFDRAPIAFVPAYRADGRRDGAWRLTWFSLAPGPAQSTNNA